jgi:hypothetical protein
MLEDLLLGFARGVLMLPSLLFDLIYALGPIIAPLAFLALLYAWPFLTLRDKKRTP